MNDPGEVTLLGKVASPGLAEGPITVIRAASSQSRAKGSPDEEQAALKSALAKASEGLQRLIDASDQMAGEILEFQLALLEDEDLLAPIWRALSAGSAAHLAWAETIDREVADYQAAEDAYFHARSADLADLRDRVLGALGLGVGAELSTAAGILAAEDLSPSRFLELDWSKWQGAALEKGSASSHVAMLARARAVPMIIGLDKAFQRIVAGASGILDAEAGALILHPGAAARNKAAERRIALAEQRKIEAQFLGKPAMTASGERVQVLINVDDPAALDRIDPESCDGIGLTRTEFLFRADRPLPGEEEQFEAYRRILAWAKGRPVTIRTLDAGGDKPIPGVTPEHEENSFLGLRGLRLSLSQPDFFKAQLRALARAASLGKLKVMLPMVTHPDEMLAARALFVEAAAEVGVSTLPPLGMMVEVPAAALTAEDFAADFYSIGSNDLVQYTTAASRDNAAVASVYNPRHPAVRILIERVVKAAQTRGVEVGLCGEMASDPALVGLLLDCGLRSLSSAPGRLASVKAAISRWPQ